MRPRSRRNYRLVYWVSQPTAPFFRVPHFIGGRVATSYTLASSLERPTLRSAFRLARRLGAGARVTQLVQTNTRRTIERAWVIA